jgi:hypothetical protein
LVLLFCSCTNDGSKEIELTERQQLQNKFYLANFGDEFVKRNLIVDWNDFVLNINKDSISDTKVYEFNTSFKVNSSLENGKLKLAVKYKILASKKSSEPWNFEIVKFLSSDLDPIDVVSYSSPSSFSGTLYHYNLNGENTKMIAYKKGKIVSEFLNKEKLASSITAKEPSIGGDTGGFWMFTRTQHYTDWYQTSNYSQGVYTYTHSTYNYTSSEYVWVSTGGNGNTDYHNHYDYPHGPSTATNNHPAELILDSSFVNNPCLKGVYDKLGKSAHFQSSLIEFDNDFALVGLKLSVGVDALYPKATAITYEPINSLIEIKFNINKLKTPPLDIARTFMHEMIHAEMYRKLLTLSGKKEIPWTPEFIGSIRNNGKQISEYYMRYKYNIPAGESPSEPQHELMAKFKRNIIKQSMMEFDGAQSEDVYNALAWIGLMGEGEPNPLTGLPPQPTAAWAATPQAERVKILKNYFDFINNNTPCQ